MYFNKENFKYWFDPKTNMLNPTIPPKNMYDVVHIGFYFISFGIVIVPIALLSSIVFNKPDSAENTKPQ